MFIESSLENPFEISGIIWHTTEYWQWKVMYLISSFVWKWYTYVIEYFVQYVVVWTILLLRKDVENDTVILYYSSSLNFIRIKLQNKGVLTFYTI